MSNGFDGFVDDDVDVDIGVDGGEVECEWGEIFDDVYW